MTEDTNHTSLLTPCNLLYTSMFIGGISLTAYICVILSSITKKRSHYSNFIQLKEILATNRQRRQAVTIEGLVDRVYQNCTPIKSDKGGAEGVARQVYRTATANSSTAQPNTNLSVPFMLNDYDNNFVCVSAIHNAKGLKSVMQDAWKGHGLCDKLLMFGTHIVLHGEIQIFGTTNQNMVMIMNPSAVALTLDSLNQGYIKTWTLCKVALLFIMLAVVGRLGWIYCC